MLPLMGLMHVGESRERKEAQNYRMDGAVIRRNGIKDDSHSAAWMEHWKWPKCPRTEGCFIPQDPWPLGQYEERRKTPRCCVQGKSHLSSYKALDKWFYLYEPQVPFLRNVA